jgi:hypothetical protein
MAVEVAEVIAEFDSGDVKYRDVKVELIRTDLPDGSVHSEGSFNLKKGHAELRPDFFLTAKGVSTAISSVTIGFGPDQLTEVKFRVDGKWPGH